MIETERNPFLNLERKIRLFFSKLNLFSYEIDSAILEFLSFRSTGYSIFKILHDIAMLAFLKIKLIITT